MPPSAADLELEFYQRFFWDRGLEPYPVQEQAVAAIMAGDSVMVTVPTGTGKTVIAKAALMAALAHGRRAVYTTPLRALTEEKYRELCVDFGEANVGFATGDFKVNREAPIQVEVAEILWNRIYADRTRHALGARRCNDSSMPLTQATSVRLTGVGTLQRSPQRTTEPLT